MKKELTPEELDAFIIRAMENRLGCWDIGMRGPQKLVVVGPEGERTLELNVPEDRGNCGPPTP